MCFNLSNSHNGDIDAQKQNVNPARNYCCDDSFPPDRTSWKSGTTKKIGRKASENANSRLEGLAVCLVGCWSVGWLTLSSFAMCTRMVENEGGKVNGYFRWRERRQIVIFCSAFSPSLIRSNGNNVRAHSQVFLSRSKLSIRGYNMRKFCIIAAVCFL